jgi:hypothetical protein
MKTSESIDKLMPALHEARKAITPAGKSGKNTFDGYDYANELDWHNAVQPALAANGLVLVFSTEAISNLPERATKKGGTEHTVQVTGFARVFHTSGQWIEVSGVGQGQDRGDKGCYKAMTGMKKYLYALMFALPTTDDPENASPGGGERAAAAKPPKKKPHKPLVLTIDAAMKEVEKITSGVVLKRTVDGIEPRMKAFDWGKFKPTVSAQMCTILTDAIANDDGENMAGLETFIADWEYWEGPHKTEVKNAWDTKKAAQESVKA